MRFLIDENLWQDAVDALRELGHDVASISADAPSSSDVEVLTRAGLEGRTLITSDKDFGDLVFRRRMPADHGVILLRFTGPLAAKTALLVRAISFRDDWSRMFAVVEYNRIRIRPVPPASGR